MEMLDRTKAPAQSFAGKIAIPQAQQVGLANGAQLVVVNAGTQEVSKVELIFDAGTRYQTQALSARGAISLLGEGTATRTSQQIAELFDFYGSFPEHSFDRDFASLTLYSTNKLLGQSLDVLADMLYNPTYPEHELDIFRRKGKQALIVEQEKVGTVARQNFFGALFGSEHPYGIFATPEDFDRLERSAIVGFHNRHHISGSCLVVLSGRVSDREIAAVETALGRVPLGQPAEGGGHPLPAVQHSPRKVFAPKDDAVQSAIRVGKPVMKRNHPDFPKFMVLNTLLGGYFGSRLMRNIREEKGYTYGISSLVLPFRDTAVFVIGTEVRADVTPDTLREIYRELDTLCSQRVTDTELNLVKSHLIGEVLRTFDGPFAIADSIASLYEYNGMDFAYFERTIDTIRHISSAELLEVANKYLGQKDFTESVVGKLEPS